MTAELVRQATHTVRIDGTVRDPDSISIERSIATSLPAQVAGGGGVVKASGTISLGEPGALVATERDSPWFRINGWPPARNAPVTIGTAMNDAAATRRFTGRVAAVESSTRDHVALDIEDYTDNLKVTISQQALLRVMPPPGENTGAMLQVGLRADYVANLVFRVAGFWTTPQVMGTGVVSVPAQGSMWPEMGTCLSCTQTSGFSAPGWRQAPWGWAVTNCLAVYNPRNIGANNTLRGRVIAQAMMVDTANNTGRVQMETVVGATTLMTRVTSEERVEVRHGGNVIGTPVPDAGWTRVETIWRANGTVRVHTDTGWSRDFTWSPGSGVLDGAVGRTTITVDSGGRAAGFVVQFAPTSYSGGYTAQNRTATIVPGTLLTQMPAMPSITSRDGLDLLGEISKSLVISLWIDRTGHLWWVHPDRLRNQSPALELTSTKDLLDLAWEDTSDSARRNVTVTYDQPTIRRKATYRLTAWEGSGDNLNQGESSEEIIGPPTDQDWIDVSDLGQSIYCTPYPSNKQELPDFNRGVGSWVGGTHLDKDGNSPQTLIEDAPDTASSWAGKQNYPSMSRSFERIGPAAWKLSTGLQDVADNTWVEIQQALDPVQKRTIPNLTDPVGSAINNSWTGQKMPIIRCKAITDWETQEYTSSITGPSQYDSLDHQTGPWAGDGYAALGDWLAEQVTKPLPILRDLPTVYRPDVQVGQVITVTEDVVYGVRLTCLVIGLREDHTRGSTTMRLTCRVIDVTRLSWTYDEMTRYWAVKGGDYDTLTATGQTYTQVESPPADLADVLNTSLVEPLPAPLPPWWPDHDDEEGS